jgi:hypothetical protein
VVLLVIGAVVAQTDRSTSPPRASATSFKVSTAVDDVDASPGDGLCATSAGDCTLRAAVMETNRDKVVVVRPGAALTHAGAFEDASTASSCAFSMSTDISNVGSQVDPLASNGGPTATHALKPGSVAIDAAVTANCTPHDQRGVARPQGSGCDIGAYESP